MDDGVRGLALTRVSKPTMQSHNIHQSPLATPVESSSILHRLADNIDLVMTLAEVMTQMQTYASLASLLMVNREYHALLDPYLKKMKARIVIELSDLDSLPLERYKEIQYVSSVLSMSILEFEFPSRSRIIECSGGSRLPIQSTKMQKAIGLSRKAAGLRPWLLTFRGNPKKYLPDVQERHFPGIEVVRVVDNDQHHTMEESEGCNHCYEMMCEEGWPGGVFEHYCSAFFNSSKDTSRHAMNFRYYASEHLPPVKAPKDRIRYELDMESLSGKTWQYRREANVREATINGLLHHAFRYRGWDSFSVRALLRADVGPHEADKVPCFFIRSKVRGPTLGACYSCHSTDTYQSISLHSQRHIHPSVILERRVA